MKTDNRINTLGYTPKVDNFPLTQDEMRAVLEADPETRRLFEVAGQFRYEALTTNDPSTYELYTTYRTLYEFARQRACRIWVKLEEACKHEHYEAGRGVLICKDCGASFTPRSWSETYALQIYGGGQSRKGYTHQDVFGGSPESGAVFD